MVKMVIILNYWQYPPITDFICARESNRLDTQYKITVIINPLFHGRFGDDELVDLFSLKN